MTLVALPHYPLSHLITIQKKPRRASSPGESSQMSRERQTGSGELAEDRAS